MRSKSIPKRQKREERTDKGGESREKATLEGKVVDPRNSMRLGEVFDVFRGAPGLLLGSPGLLWVGFGGAPGVSGIVFYYFLGPGRPSKRKLRNA